MMMTMIMMRRNFPTQFHGRVTSFSISTNYEGKNNDEKKYQENDKEEKLSNPLPGKGHSYFFGSRANSLEPKSVFPFHVLGDLSYLAHGLLVEQSKGLFFPPQSAFCSLEPQSLLLKQSQSFPSMYQVTCVM